MYVIMAAGNPKVLVKTEAEAQELVADLNWEFMLDGFNWMMRFSTISESRALRNITKNEYTYKKLEVL